MSNPGERLDAVLAYARRGWPVFPLHSVQGGTCSCGKAECTSPGKHPLAKLAPQGFKDATTDENKIRAWWQAEPQANVAIRTGEGSGIIVLDVDPRNGGEITLEVLIDEHGELPDTVEAFTGGGGRHLLFEHPDGYVKGDSKGNVLGAGLDIKADGGYIVAPPSLHVSGRRYVWEASSGPDDVPVAPLPGWMLDKIKVTPKTRSVTSPVDWRIPKGQRNSTLTSIAGTIRRKALDADEIEPMLQAVNRTRCKPPLTEDEVSRIAQSVARYPPDASAFAVPSPMAPEQIGVLVSEVEREHVEWLWHGRLALGKLTVIDGDPGLGKSALYCDMAAYITTGRTWPDGASCLAGGVVIVTTEDCRSHSCSWGA